MTHGDTLVSFNVVINLMGIKVRECDILKPIVPNVIRFLKEMKELEKETNGAVTLRASVSAKEVENV